MSVLTVGFCCTDIVIEVPEYPKEDTDVRFTSARKAKGGNASNTAIVLAILGLDCHFCGTFGSSTETEFLLKELRKYDIGTDLCQMRGESHFPVSYCIVSQATGSRTIISGSKLPELSYSYLSGLEFSLFRWVHFEGRNVENVEKLLKEMINREGRGCRSLGSEEKPRPIISVEVENVLRDMSSFFSLGDIVFVAKDYSVSLGARDMMHATRMLMEKWVRKSAVVVCPWGEQGAAVGCYAEDGELLVFSSNSFPPPKIINSIAAGDTFAAAFIYAALTLELLQPDENVGYKVDATKLQRIVTFACRVAGMKIGLRTFEEFNVSMDSLKSTKEFVL